MQTDVHSDVDLFIYMTCKGVGGSFRTIVHCTLYIVYSIQYCTLTSSQIFVRVYIIMQQCVCM